MACQIALFAYCITFTSTPCRINQITMENNLWLNISSVSLLLNFFPCLYIFYQLHPYTLVRLNLPGASLRPIIRQKSLNTFTVVRHPELIALYASALNHVLGQ